MNNSKLLLVDSNNLACRICFAQPDLKNCTGVFSGLHYGFFQSLIGFKKTFPSHDILIVWDGKSARRQIESEEGVRKGIVPATYKANRKKDDVPQPLKDFYQQSPFLRRALNYTGIPQIQYNDFEADDVIASYVELLKNNLEDIVCLTSDKDYFQLLDHKVRIFDGMKMSEITYSSFKNEWQIEPKQWIDMGAMTGDDGDGIWGVPGWGEKTALKEIKTYGSWQSTIKYYEEKHQPLLLKYPDYSNTPSPEEISEFEEIIGKAKSEKGKLKFPDVKITMPYTNVLLAFAKGKIKMPKTEIMALVFRERVALAFSLKKMDIIIDLPEIKQGEFNKARLLEYLDYYDIQSLKDSVDVFGK